MTTPSSFFIQKFLRNAVEKKCDYAIVETTSHGLVQYRHWGIPYQIVVLTNLMPDHLDYHKTYENYRDSHLRLFNKNLKTLILNKDDQRLEYFEKKFEKYQKTNGIVDFSIKNQANFFANEIKLEKEGTVFEIIRKRRVVVSPSENNNSIKVNFPLLGEFNVSNCLAAVAVGSVCKVSLDKIKNALEKIKGIEGRLEKIKMAGQNFEVIVDYAHSPDSLETFYKTVVPYAKGKIIAVLGACGDRDKTYRPALGKLAAKYADYVIVTNEDPYSEKPEDIIEQVSEGVEEVIKSKVEGYKVESKIEKYFKILDRKEAIKKAIDLAEENDLVLITGKGAEQWIVYGASGEKKVPWDDRKVVREIIKEKLK
jgi:UDP-N-acetylmuramoyl-L-alanyl-D-glutamate--2,6-diaminopimelate ligase